MARPNPSMKEIVHRVTQKMKDDGDVRELCDVSIYADDVPIQVRRFSCMQCPHGVTSHDLTAPQMRDHINVLHTGRGDKVPAFVQAWLIRQAKNYKKTMAALKIERQNA